MLSITNLAKRYGDETAVRDVSLSVDRGEFCTLLGPSGCGKTTTLLAVAGHVTPTAGTVRLDGEDLAGVPPEHRSMGVVFQRDALFPHMTALENVAYALRAGEYTDRERRERTADYLALVGMADHAEKYPDRLSGGQRRRVELARALVYEPDVLLLDEPLTGLDRQLRRELRSEIARIHEETNVTTVYVTHDQAEALSLSDRIAVLHDGGVVGSGRPRDLYERPPNEFVASFLGPTATLSATVVETDPATVEWCGYRLRIDGALDATEGDRIRLFLRPEDVGDSVTGDQIGCDVTVEGVVDDVARTGPRSTVGVETPDGSRLGLSLSGFADLEPDDRLTIGFDADVPYTFAGGQRLSVASVAGGPDSGTPRGDAREDPTA